MGEADVLLTLFSKNRGKLRVIAKGARKASSRKAGHISQFTESEMLLAQGRNLDIVTQAQVLTSHRMLREDLERLTHASHLAELVDGFTVEEDPHEGLYILLKQALEWVAVDKDAQLATRHFEVFFLELVGYRPLFFQCAECEQELEPQDQYLSAEQGGVICPKCRGMHQHSIPISLASLKVLRFLQLQEHDQVMRLRVSESLHMELEQVMRYLIQHHLERAMKSSKFLKRLRSEGLGSK